MKRFLISFLVLGLLSPLAGFIAPPSAFANFSDVSTGNAHYTAIQALVDQGILEGYEEGDFRPDASVNRAEALKMIVLGTGAETEAAKSTVFSDVQSEDWFYNSVQAAAEQGFVKGYDDGSFKPEQTVVRAEAAKILLLAARVKLSAVSAAPFEDVSTEAWYASYASYARSQNVIAPQTDGLWHPDTPLTRGDLAEMVYRMQKVQSTGNAYDEASTWTRLDFPTVDLTLKMPHGWQVKQEGVGAVFLMDSAHRQLSLLDPYENGGTLLMTRYPNNEGADAEELFDAIRANEDVETVETRMGGHKALVLNHENGETYREWYVYLPNKKLIHFVALRGDGAYSPYLEWFLEAVAYSLEYAPAISGTQTIDEIVADLREAIQVDSVGKAMMELLKDWELFETDSIGVGTGPVDYYYSPSANITIKYERSFDVFLDIRDGKSSAF